MANNNKFTLKSHFCLENVIILSLCIQRCYASQRFLKICKPLVYCMALFHSSTQRQVIKKRITESYKQSSNFKHMLRLNKMFQRKNVNIFLPIGLNIRFGAQKNCLVQTILLSTHDNGIHSVAIGEFPISLQEIDKIWSETVVLSSQLDNFPK